MIWFNSMKKESKLLLQEKQSLKTPLSFMLVFTGKIPFLIRSSMTKWIHLGNHQVFQIQPQYLPTFVPDWVVLFWGLHESYFHKINETLS